MYLFFLIKFLMWLEKKKEKSFVALYTYFISCDIFRIYFVLTGVKIITELLRVIRRLSMKDQWVDDSLQYLTLKILCLALYANPRGQNHFKSIGGLEVLLDGLGVPSNYVRTYGKSSLFNGLRYFNCDVVSQANYVWLITIASYGDPSCLYIY